MIIKLINYNKNNLYMLTTKILYETSKKEGDLQNIKNKNKKQIYKKIKKLKRKI